MCWFLITISHRHQPPHTHDQILIHVFGVLRYNRWIHRNNIVYACTYVNLHINTKFFLSGTLAVTFSNLSKFSFSKVIWSQHKKSHNKHWLMHHFSKYNTGESDPCISIISTIMSLLDAPGSIEEGWGWGLGWGVSNILPGNKMCFNWPNSQSHNTSVPYPTMHQSHMPPRTILWDIGLMHCGIGLLGTSFEDNKKTSGIHSWGTYIGLGASNREMMEYI